ncbi:MAG: phosphoribosylformylglycinamidine synthase subunit PurS [Acidobacteriota bacterium]
MKIRIYVTLKEGILDPQGKVVGRSLRELGFDEVRDVRIGRYIELDLEDGGSDPRPRIEEMCRQLLANPVIEDFRVEGPE